MIKAPEESCDEKPTSNSSGLLKTYDSMRTLSITITVPISISITVPISITISTCACANKKRANI